jgi:hypothetical protein
LEPAVTSHVLPIFLVYFMTHSQFITGGCHFH